MSKKKEAFLRLRDLFEANQGVVLGSEVYPDYEYLYNTLYKGMEETGTLDSDYLDHIPKSNGVGYRMLALLGTKDEDGDYTSLQDCYTALTFVLRARELKHINDLFDMFTDNGDIYRALARICNFLE